MNKPTKCRIVFTMGGKGGAGKSGVISKIAQKLQRDGIEFVIVDADDETSTTSRFFPSAIFIAIRSILDIDRIVEMALSGKYSVILVDLPARASAEFSEWVKVVPWEELREMGIAWTAIGVVCGNKDSIECILNWIEFLGSNVDYVIVLNRRDCLTLYEESRARQTFIAAGYQEIEIAKLDERYSYELDKKSWTITAALNSSEPHFLTQLMSRARLRRYLDTVFLELDKIGPLLHP
jgi:hypothetical protein